jgi:16S rRNA processing protein RimM
MTATAPGRVEIGYVARAHGIRGEIAAVPHDPESTSLGDLPALWIRGQRYEVLEARDTPKGFLIALSGIDDRNAAEALRGAAIEATREDLALDDDDVLIQDLVGCQTRLADGTPWGEVVGLDLGPQVRLIVRDGNIERMLPLVDALVPSIDLATRTIIVAPPDGLPEDPVEP